MRTYELPARRVLITLTLVCAGLGLTGCTQPVLPQEVVGTWTLVASGFEPQETVVPNDRFSGWVTFKDDMTYEMEMLEKGRPRPVHRSGTFSIEGNTLRTVSGAKVTNSRITFQGDYLVTRNRQIKNKQNFYIYYLPENKAEKKAEAQP